MGTINFNQRHKRHLLKVGENFGVSSLPRVVLQGSPGDNQVSVTMSTSILQDEVGTKSQDELEQPCSSSSNEQQRMRALKSLRLLDGVNEERFARITRLVKAHFKTAVCTITLLDQKHLRFLAPQGVEPCQILRSEAVCAMVVEQDQPVVIPDLTDHHLGENFRKLTHGLGMRFYAGVPLNSPDGWPVGALCILDQKDPGFTSDDLRILSDFSLLVENEMAASTMGSFTRDLLNRLQSLEVRAYIDPLTEVWNRGAVLELATREMERARRCDSHFAAAMVDLDHFKSINDTYGHAVGDFVLKETAHRMSSVLRKYDGVGRLGGEEFLLLLPSTKPSKVPKVLERVRRTIGDTPYKLKNGLIRVTASIGYATLRSRDTLDRIVDRADEALYKAKREGRNRLVRFSE